MTPTTPNRSERLNVNAAPSRYVRDLADVRLADVPLVGGKNASTGEMLSTLQKQGLRVPAGFAATTHAFEAFLDANSLRYQIASWLRKAGSGGCSWPDAGRAIREAVMRGRWPTEVRDAVTGAYRALSAGAGEGALDVAVRSSATAEDLPDASFAGQHDTFLNVRGEEEVLDACKRCYASLFTDRAITYRNNQGIEHLRVSLSVGVQRMVRSDRAGAGVIFTIDTESGFPHVMLINAGWGLGENVVGGTINPDQYLVYKPFVSKSGIDPILERTKGSKRVKRVYTDDARQPVADVETTEAERAAFVLSDAEIVQLARWAAVIEKHYGRPMDVEWAKDGGTGDLFIVQARPETVESQKGSTMKAYHLRGVGPTLVKGLSVGSAIAAGKVVRIMSPAEIDRVEAGSILVTTMTDPDWVPIMRKAAGIITDSGGRTCHAAIVSRELGIPAIVGTGHATEVLEDGRLVTLSCAGGDEGVVYGGRLDFEVEELDPASAPATRTAVLMNIGTPSSAFRWWKLPTDGVGLARMEFIIGNMIKIHPMALVRFDRVSDVAAREEILRLTAGYEDKTEYFVEHLARAIAKIAAAHYPKPVVVRTSDFKTNEYANLIGGRVFEPTEENPMLGWRGASRYYRDGYREGFALECRALRYVRERMGFTNVIAMIPFCRTLDEADKVLDTMASNGLERGKAGLQVYMMCEVPSNVILADGFAKRFDGFSIGSNDLTQLTLGVDRDSAELSDVFDERNEAVLRMIRMVIDTAHAHGVKVGICGQAPSDYPEFAEFLVKAGIDSISLNPDSVLATKKRIHEAEAAFASVPQPVARRGRP